MTQELITRPSQATRRVCLLVVLVCVLMGAVGVGVGWGSPLHPAVPAHPTATSVVCVPAGSGPSDVLPVNGSSACTVTVSDTSATGKVAPTGSVNFSSDDPSGTFDSTNCTLNDNGDGMSSSCTVNYFPPDAGTPTITAMYVNDPGFATSLGHGDAHRHGSPDDDDDRL